MSELNEFQKWCKDILPVVQAAANGEAVEYCGIDGVWRPCLSVSIPSLVVATIKYRIKPKTIKVNGFDVPEPMRVALVAGSTYWVVSLVKAEMCVSYTWYNDRQDSLYLSRGICHTTAEAAVAHAKAMLGINPNKD